MASNINTKEQYSKSNIRARGDSAIEKNKEVLALTKRLINIKSITPNDSGCQKIISQELRASRFKITHIDCDDTSNLWAAHGDPHSKPLILLSGHTDVVPPGDGWDTDPFKATKKNGMLYGRGAADMKANLAAMIIAAKHYVDNHPNHPGCIAFAITSDEEGTGKNGTVKIIEHIQKSHHTKNSNNKSHNTHPTSTNNTNYSHRSNIINTQANTSQSETLSKIAPDYCIIGEATSEHILGDQIRIGRRGSLSGKLTIKGKQGHVAYADLACNPVHKFSYALPELCSTTWDNTPHPDFPPTSFQISNIHAGTGANNVIPGELTIDFNFRFNPNTDIETLKDKFNTIINNIPHANCSLSTSHFDNKPQGQKKHIQDSNAKINITTNTPSSKTTFQHEIISYSIDWNNSATPYINDDPKFANIVSDVLYNNCGIRPRHSTGGGVSDGKHLHKICPNIVEIGPINKTIHQINEHIKINDLIKLVDIHHELLSRIVCQTIDK